MIEATASEFGFVADLPKAERRQVKSLWDRFREFTSLMESKGSPVPPVLAAKLLNISRQRVWELANEGKLERVEFEGHPFITENSIVNLAGSERKAGRPFKVTMPTFKDCLSTGRDLVKDSRR